MTQVDHYWKLAESERGFNDSQAGIRTLASAWLLVGLGAIGMLLRSEGGTDWLIPRGTLVVLVCALAGTGLATLWVMDQLVFNRLLDAVFLVGIRMEFQDRQLPPIRSMMMMSAEGRGMHRWQRLFYMVPMLAFLTISVLVVAGTLDRPAGDSAMLDPRWMAGINWVLIAFQAAVLIWLLSKQVTMAFAGRAAMFGDDDFTRLIRDGDYVRIIRSYCGSSSGSKAFTADDAEDHGDPDD